MLRPLALSSRALVALLALLVARQAYAQSRGCPAAQHIPQLTIDKIVDPPLPVTDEWQVFWGPMALSDVQLTQLAGDDTLNDLTRTEINARGSWVYLGMLLGAGGAGASSAGWVLFGQDKVSKGFSLPLAVGGLLLGVVGLLVVTEHVQTPLEPLLAPTPVHRLSREQVRALVSRVNQRIYREVCKAAEDADADDSGAQR